MPKPRQQDGPDQPVYSPGGNYAHADDTMKIVWETLVDILARVRWYKWCHDKIDVAEEEQQSNWPRGTERRSPIELRAPPVQVEQTCRDEAVDD